MTETTAALRVLEVLGSSAGGVARHVAQVAAGARARGVHVAVAGPRALAQQVAPAGSVPFRAVEITDRPGPGDVGAVLRLRTLCRGADVVHAHGLRAGALTVIGARTLRRRPAVVVTLHNLPVGSRFVVGVAAVLEQVVARGADAVLGVSGDLVARARARGAAHAERALVPAPPRPAATAPPATVRAELGVAPGTHLLVTVARLAPQKGLDLLCDAAALLAGPGAGGGLPGPAAAGPSGAQVLWVLAGDGPLEPELAARIEAESLPVRLLGRRDDVADLMAAADVVVSTARWEGQPLGVQEALALGAAVVATDVGGTAEVTGDAAVLVQPRAQDLAHALRDVLERPAERERLRAAAAVRAGELPGPDDTLDQLERVWAAAARRRPDRGGRQVG